MKTTSKHIKSSIDKYNELVNKEYLLSPISKTDVGIVNELLELFKKLGKNEVVAVMDNYKLNPDEEILQDLMQLSTYFKESVLEDDEFDDEVEKPSHISFNDTKEETLKLKYILRYSKGVNEKGYYIFINECPDEIKTLPFLANTFLYYDDEMVRDEDLNELKILLE